MSRYRLAVGTGDGAHLNSHFGRTERFDVYDLNTDYEVVKRYRNETAHSEPPLFQGQTKGETVRSANADEASNDLYQYVETRFVASACNNFSHDENRLLETAHKLGDCQCVLVQSIGPGAENVLTLNGIDAFVSEKDVPDALTSLARYLAATEALHQI